MTFAVYGTPTSSGIAIGRVHLDGAKSLDIASSKIDATDLASEKQRLEEAVYRAVGFLDEVKSKIPSSSPPETVSFVNTHIQMVRDESLRVGVASIIESNNCSAEWALRLYEKDISSFFDKTEDPYFKSRKEDVRQVINVILKNFRSQLDIDILPAESLQSSIVIARDLSPSDVIMLSRKGILGFCTESGATLSHTAILARSLRLPFVIGVQNAMSFFRDGEVVVIDGENGLIIGELDNKTLSSYKSRVRIKNQEEMCVNTTAIRQDVLSLDGSHINILLNLDIFEDIYEVPEYETYPIGLFRTEFLFMNSSDVLTESEQVEIYKNILRRSNGQEITIRTADLGPDKLPVLLRDSLPEGAVSALGLRGLRLSLVERKLFLSQLRAVIRASAFGKVRLLLPMVTGVDEIFEVREIIKNIKKEFLEKGIDFAKDIPLGAMIEVPAAAASCSLLAAELDFLSIGSNDLVQYANAADRQNNHVSYLYQPIHPGVVQLIFWSVSAAKKLRKPIFLCGEMASDPKYLPLLLGLGLTQVSVRPSMISHIRKKIENTSVKSSTSLVERFISSGDSALLKELLDD